MTLDRPALQRAATDEPRDSQPVFIRMAESLTRRSLMRRAALTAIAVIAITAGHWGFAKPLLVYARSCDICLGACSTCSSCFFFCPSPTGACSCGGGCCTCTSWGDTGNLCQPVWMNIVVLSCEFPCGCTVSCDPC